MRYLYRTSLLIVLWAVLSRSAFPDPKETAHSLNCGGSIATNSSYRGVAVIGQGLCLDFSDNAAHLSQQGFLTCHLLQSPSGADRDADGLSDWIELTGMASSPRQQSSISMADSDSDEFPDKAEIAAGTNPMDPRSRLALTSIAHSNGYVLVTWLGRDGFSYDLFRSDTAGGVTSSLPVATITGLHGMGLWQSTSVTATQTMGSAHFYQVGLSP